MADAKNLFDTFMDKAEEIVGGVEKAFNRHAWKADEVTDAETGKVSWIVTNSIRTFEASCKEDAEWLVEALGSEK